MIAIGSDHAGFEAKEKIRDYIDSIGIKYKDLGTYNRESVDYPFFAKSVAESVASGECEKGILMCGTGIGVCIAANKVKGIRAALCFNKEYAVMARKHNDANILCIGGRTTDKKEIISIADAFLKSEFEGGRHKDRVNEISDIENNCE